MKHLRIKFVGELDHLLLLHFEWLGFKASANFQVVEVDLFHFEIMEGWPLSRRLKFRIEQRVNAARFV